MFNFEKSIAINKTPHQVFEFVANPANAHQWREDVLETKVQSLPIKTGDIFEEVIDVNGTVSSVVRVVDMVPDVRLVLKVESGSMYLPKRELFFAQEGAHTRVTIKISAHSDGFTRLMEPISSNGYSLKWENYLFSLKRVLESD